MDASLKELQVKVENEALVARKLLSEVQNVIVGQEALLKKLLIALFAKGHILVEACRVSQRRSRSKASRGP